MQIVIFYSNNHYNYNLQSLEVAEAVYMIDWTVLTKKTKMGLLMMIARARRPIIITGGSLITMSLDTFVNVSLIP